MKVVVIIPAFNEEESLPLVLADLPRERVAEVIVVDNASTDRTGEVAAKKGARVVREERPGYGSACLRGIAALPPDTDVVVFLDADYSDHPEELVDILRPLEEDGCDLVIGSRLRGKRQPGALLPQAYFGNHLATSLIRLLWGFRYTDLGPFRAIRAGKQLSDSKGASAAISTEVAIIAMRRAMRGFIGPKDIFRNPEAIFRLFEPTAGDSPFDLAKDVQSETSPDMRCTRQ